MKIALIQQHSGPDKMENLQRGLKSARQAIVNGAKVICFAELAFEPFYPQKPAGPDSLTQAETIPGPITNAFGQLAAEENVVFVLNLFEAAGGQTFDSSPVIDANGLILGTTRMIHITDYPCFHEQGFYAKGNNGAPVYKTRFGNVGVAICYDRHFPEYMRAMAMGGADIVFVPQAGAVNEWPRGLYEAELRVAAFQNGYFAALCNRVGKEEMLTFAGESFVCSPEGTVIARAGQGTEEILFCEIDFQLNSTSYARTLFLRDRRPELYVEWFGG